MSLTLEWRHRIIAWREELARHFFVKAGKIPVEAAFTMDQFQRAQALEGLTFKPIEPGTAWGVKWEYGWFKGEFSVPSHLGGKIVALAMDVGAEAVVYVNEAYAGAVDEFHKVILLTESAVVGDSYSIVMEAYGGHGGREWRAGPTPPDRDTVPEPPLAQQKLGESCFGVWNEVAFQLAMDVETLWDIRENIDPESLRVMEIDEGLKDFTLIADFEAPEDVMLKSLQSARDRLKPLLEKHNGDTTPEMVGFGHAHIDVAWLWPLAETERKCVRTFSTQLALMARYPEFRFLQSQPHLYVMVKEKYPDLYEKILEAVERGQWIPDGASWVEPDTNLTSGESLIRQLIHGKRFYKDEFGVDCEMLWLPDVFGYSGALPQIMRGCGVRFFSTQKIFWAYTGGEPFPYNTFIWEGIDGSEVMAHFHNDYNSETRPEAVIRRWDERVQKDGFSKRLFPFGHGDGGGGPTRAHLEFALRQKDLEGAPKFRIDSPISFFREQEEAGWPDVRYVGELYFQAHRGTYTSQARTKALNRYSEFALREAEMWGAAAIVLRQHAFAFERWDAAWKMLLLNQFHDILPGSSIHRVHEESEEQLTEVIETATEMTEKATGSFVNEDEEAWTLFNSLSWKRHALVELPEGVEGLISDVGEALPAQKTGESSFAELPLSPIGWKSFSEGAPVSVENLIMADPTCLENDLVRVRFNDFGEITSIYDKGTGQELADGVCNKLCMYQDIPSTYDAWDMDSMYSQSPVALPEKAQITVTAQGPLFGQLVIRRKLNNSLMEQTVTLQRGSRRMDFHTRIDWQERHKLLKVNFPVKYHAQNALHEIQFGHLERPTHRSRKIDQDRFEVPNNKWTALVESNRGFAILNDSKYGVNVLKNSINLTLLKSALAPDMTADRGWQEFTHAFYYWNTPFIESRLVQQGYELNIAPLMIPGRAESRSLFELDQANIVLETVKPPEDRAPGEMVLRLYEAMGTRTQTRLKINLNVDHVYQADMLEQVQSELPFDGQGVDLEFAPFKIVTLRLVCGRE